MKKMKHRILSLTLAACMIAALISIFGITSGAVLGENEAIYAVNVNDDGVTNNVIVAEYNEVSYVMGAIHSDGTAEAVPAAKRDTWGNNIIIDETKATRFTVASERYYYSSGSYSVYSFFTESGYIVDNYGIDYAEHKLTTVEKESITTSDETYFWRFDWSLGWYNWYSSYSIYLVVEDGEVVYFNLGYGTPELGKEYISTNVFSKACQHPNMQYVPAVAPTCKQDGNAAHWYCPDCAEANYAAYFADEDGLNGMFDPPVILSYGAIDTDHNGVCDDCGKNMPVFKKVTEESQIVAGGKYILVTKVGDQYYAAATGTEQFGAQLPALAITSSEDGSFSFENATGAMTIELQFANGCTEWGNGIRYGFITNFNGSLSEFAPMGAGEFYFEGYDIRGAKYGFYVGLNSDHTAKIHSAYDEADVMRSYTYGGTQLFTSADYSENAAYTASPVYLYRLTDVGTVNSVSYEMMAVKSDTDYSTAIESGSAAEGGTNVAGITDAMTQTAIDSIVSSFVADCSVPDGQNVQINTSVDVTVIGYASESSITFSLTPTAVVSINETTKSYPIYDSAFDRTTPMTVTLYTGGICPVRIIHEKEDGTKECFYPEWSKEVMANGANPFYELYDHDGNMYVRFTVTEFSNVKLLTEVVDVTESAEFTGISVSLAEDIRVNYYVALPKGFTDSKVRFTMNGKSTLVDGELYDEINSIYRFVYTGVAPQCIGDEIKAEIVSGEEIPATNYYSVKAYLDDLKTMTAEQLGYSEAKYNAMLTLINDLLVYGGAAQKYTGHHTGALVSEGIVGTPFTELTETDQSAVNNGVGITVKSATVFFGSINKIRIRFTAESTDGLVVKARVAGGAEKELEITTDGTYYYVHTDGIPATGFDDVYTFTAYVNGSAGATVTYSLRSYVNAMQNSANTTMADLAKATYNYGRAAKAFSSVE